MSQDSEKPKMPSSQAVPGLLCQPRQPAGLFGHPQILDTYCHPHCASVRGWGGGLCFCSFVTDVGFRLKRCS